MRLFVAINPGSEERAQLEQAVEGLRAHDYPIRWLPAENVHLTLKFLGEVSEEKASEIAQAMGEATRGIGSFEMEVGGFGAFPSARRPSVVWVGVERSRPLADLHRRMEGALESLGFSRERRRFRPHLTLGRVRKKVSADEFRGFPDLLSQTRFATTVDVRRVDLVQSRLSPDGASYETLHHAELES